MTATTANFSLSFDDILDQAYGMAVGGEAMSGDDARRARQYIQTMFTDWNNRGAMLWTILDHAPVTLAVGQSVFTADADTVDVDNLRIDYGDGILVPFERVGRAAQKDIPDPTYSGKPVQAYVDRQIDSVNINIWPLPDQSNYTVHMVKWRRMRDVIDYGDTVDIQQRFYEAAILGLAFRILRGRPLPQDASKDSLDAIMARTKFLKDEYTEAFDAANRKDDDGGPVEIQVTGCDYYR